MDFAAYKNVTAEAIELDAKVVDEESPYGEQTPSALHYRMVDKSLS